MKVFVVCTLGGFDTMSVAELPDTGQPGPVSGGLCIPHC